MKHIWYVCIYLLTAAYPAYAPPIIIDEIIAIVYTPQGKTPIKLSDLGTGFDGEPRTFKMAVCTPLIEYLAHQYQITCSDEEVDKFFSEVQKANRWTRDQLMTEFENLGYSYQEARELVRSRRLINQVLQFKVESEVSDEEVTQEYEKNPPHEESQVTIEFAFVPFTQYTAKQIDTYVETQKIPDDIQFEESQTYKISELAEGHKIIASQPIDTVMITGHENDGSVLSRLAKKIEPRPLPLSECYTMISNTLRQKKFESQLQKFYDELISKAHIVILDPQFSTPEHGVKAVASMDQ